MTPYHANAATTSTGVLIRFGVRLVMLTVFAFVAHIGFSHAFPQLLLFGGLFCGLWALVRGEPIFGPALTHWDEAATLIVIGRLAAAIT
jgi:hypothetical protein